VADIIRIRWTLPTRQDVTTSSRLAITRAALQAISGIKQDTGKGIDATGAVFRPYTRQYATRRTDSGRKSSPPDLTLTGTMLRGLRLLRVESDTRAIIGWEGQHSTRDALARRSGAKGRSRIRSVPYAVLVPALNRKRRFFAIARDERRRKILDVYRKTLSAGLKAQMQRPSARTAVR
jgi:hypothetical protein